MAPPGLGGCGAADLSHSRNRDGGSFFCQPRSHAGKGLMGVGIQVEKLNAWFGKNQALYDISMDVRPNHATAIIGPSGCGKSTFVRCINRMHEIIPETRVSGKVRIGDMEVYGNGTPAVQVRRHVGMVFQKPNPFPAMSIYDNVAAGLKLNGFRDRGKD